MPSKAMLGHPLSQQGCRVLLETETVVQAFSPALLETGDVLANFELQLSCGGSVSATFPK